MTSSASGGQRPHHIGASERPRAAAAAPAAMALFAAAALLALCAVSQQPNGAAAQSSSRRRSGSTRCPAHSHSRRSDEAIQLEQMIYIPQTGEQCVCDVNYQRERETDLCTLDSSFDGDIGSTSCVDTGYSCALSNNYDTDYCSQHMTHDSVCWEGSCYRPSSCLSGAASAADRQEYDQDERASSNQRTFLIWALGVAVGLSAAAIVFGPGGRGASTGAAVGVVLPRGTAVHGMMHISHIDNSCCGDQASGCAWYTDAETCLLALLCPCILYGLNRERAGLARFCCGDCALFALLPTVMFFVMLFVIYVGHDVVTVGDIGFENSVYRLVIEVVVVVFTPSVVLGGLQARNRTQLRMVMQGRNPTGWNAGLCGSADSVFLYVGSYVVDALLPFIYIPPLMSCLVACASAQVRGLPIRPACARIIMLL